MREERPDAIEVLPAYRLQSTPEHSVMHDQQICISICGRCHRAQRKVHCSRDPIYGSTVRQLESVQCIRIIRYRVGFQQIVQIANDESSCRHSGTLSVLASICFRAESSLATVAGEISDASCGLSVQRTTPSFSPSR